MTKNFWRNFGFYLKLPEMQLFWYFLLLLLIILAIDILYLPIFWTLISFGIFLILGMFIVFNNLRLAESNLQIKTERNELKSVIMNLRDGVIIYGPNFRILIFNPAAEQIFGIKTQEIVGQLLTPERAKEPLFKLLAQVIFPSLAPTATRRSEPGVYPQVVDMSFDEPSLYLRVISDRIIDSSGRVTGFIKLIRDRTREIELMRSKSEFIGVAAHQLRTPMTAVNWSLENLLKESLNESQKEIAETGRRAAAVALRNVNDLLDVSKIEEGRFGYNFESVDIIDFIEKALEEINDSVRRAGVKVYFQKPAEESIAATIDTRKLGVVLTNLLDNAIKYNVQNGEVTVGVEQLKDKPYVQISIKDTGLGIPAEEVKRLFAKFFRAENAIRAVPDGIGLGLYIAKNIVKRHGGEIWAESQINRGSTFYFTIPTDPKLIPAKEIIWGEE